MQTHDVEAICRAGAKKVVKPFCEGEGHGRRFAHKHACHASRKLLRSKSQIRVGTRRYRKTRC